MKPSGISSGMGKSRLELPTPHIIAVESTSLYGISPVSNSHSTTPNDLSSNQEQVMQFSMDMDEIAGMDETGLTVIVLLRNFWKSAVK